MSESEPQNSPENSPPAPLEGSIKNSTKKGRVENLTSMGKGRPKGVLNKTTQGVKKAIEEAFDRAGGVEYLVKVANKDPRAFLALLAKLIPTDIKVEGSVTHALFTADQLRRMADAQEEGESQIIDVTPISSHEVDPSGPATETQTQDGEG